MSRSFKNLPINEQLLAYKAWLDSNESHTLRSSIAEMKELLEDKKRWSLLHLHDEYPKLVDRTRSGFYFTQKSPHAEVEQTVISDELFESVGKILEAGGLCTATYVGPASFNCDSEEKCSMTVQALLEAIITELGLNKIIEITQKRTLAGAECDILLLYIPNRLPFAALEIKKPPYSKEERDRLFHGDEAKGGNRVAGEVWSEINAVRLFGFDKVYGMISTFNQFRLVCTGDMNDESDNCDAMRESLEELKKKSRDLVAEPENDEISNEIVTSPGRKSVKSRKRHGAERTAAILFASQIIPNLDDDTKPITTVEGSGREILRLVALFILKACTTLTKLLNSGGASKNIQVYKDMPCRIITNDENEFSFGTVSLNELKLDQFIDCKKTRKIHVIHHLGMGGSGNCCLGVSCTGKSSCVVKFYHAARKRETRQVADEEYKNWGKIYGEQYGPPMAFRLNLVVGRCLVMPYLKPIPESDRHTLLEKRNDDNESRIEETLRTFAQKGYKHEDVKWRHFGYWGEQIFLLDLERVAKVNEDEINSWVTETVEKLRKKAGEVKTRRRSRPEHQHQEIERREAGKRQHQQTH